MTQSFKQFLTESRSEGAGSAPSAASQVNEQSNLHALGFEVDVYNGRRLIGAKRITAHLYKRLVKKLANVNHVTVDGTDYFPSNHRNSTFVETGEKIATFTSEQGDRLFMTTDLKKLIWD